MRLLPRLDIGVLVVGGSVSLCLPTPTSVRLSPSVSVHLCPTLSTVVRPFVRPSFTLDYLGLRVHVLVAQWSGVSSDFSQGDTPH